jgi:hypothetical protein
MTVHQKKCKALKEGETPEKPRYPFWKKFVQDPKKFDGECWSIPIYNHINSDVEQESDEELLSRTKISKRKLKAFEKKI